MTKITRFRREITGRLAKFEYASIHPFYFSFNLRTLRALVTWITIAITCIAKLSTSPLHHRRFGFWNRWHRENERHDRHEAKENRETVHSDGIDV